MQLIMTYKVDPIEKERMKAKHTQAPEQVSMNIINANHAATSARPMDKQNQRIENNLTVMTSKGSLHLSSSGALTDGVTHPGL